MADKLTINDIARLAGVSKATVSRVLNRKPDVDPATRERILHIIEEQSFVPNMAASGLAGGQSRLIGVLVPSLTWHFIPYIIRGVAEAVAQTSYDLVLYSMNDLEQDKSDALARILTTKLTAGLLGIVPGQSATYVTRLHKHGMPIVIIDDQIQPPAHIPWVGVDNLSGAYTAVRHLIRLGHRRIAHIRGPMRNLCCQERHQGYCKALQEAGITPNPEWILDGDFTSEGGEIAARKLFALPPEKRPTAIFASSDPTAYGIISAAEEAGVRIPGDIALVGFDDLETSAYIRPGLTTIRQPFVEMGRKAMELLFSMLNTQPLSKQPLLHQPFGAANQTESEPVRVYLDTRLVVRASCGASQGPQSFAQAV